MPYSLKGLIKEKVKFVYYRKGELWYSTESGGFMFPVPISDTGDGTFCAEDSGLYFMRWIRKQLDEINKEIA